MEGIHLSREDESYFSTNGIRMKCSVAFVEKANSNLTFTVPHVPVKGKSEGFSAHKAAYRHRQWEDPLIIGACEGLCSVISSWNLCSCGEKGPNTCSSKGPKPAISSLRGRSCAEVAAAWRESRENLWTLKCRYQPGLAACCFSLGHSINICKIQLYTISYLYINSTLTIR